MPLLRVLIALSLAVVAWTQIIPSCQPCGGDWFECGSASDTPLGNSCPDGYTDATRDECLHLNASVVGQTCDPPQGDWESAPYYPMGCLVGFNNGGWWGINGVDDPIAPTRRACKRDPTPTVSPTPKPSFGCYSDGPANCVPCTTGGDDCGPNAVCVDGGFVDPRDCEGAGTGNVVTFVTGQGIESVPPCDNFPPMIYIDSASGCDISGDVSRRLGRKPAFGYHVPEEIVPEDVLIVFDVCIDSLTLKEAKQQRPALRQAGADAAGVDVSQVSVTFIIGCAQDRRRLQATEDFVTVQYDITVPGTDGLTGVAAVRGQLEGLTPDAFDVILEEEGVSGVSTTDISDPEIGEPRTDTPTVSPTGSAAPTADPYNGCCAAVAD